MDSEMVVITWQEYHRIIVDLLLVGFIFAKFNTVLKNVEKGKYLKLKINKCFDIFEQNSGTFIVFCLFCQGRINVSYFGYVLSNASALLQHLLYVFLPLWYQNTFKTL